MPEGVAGEDLAAIDRALSEWRQGDLCLAGALEFLHMADLSRPHSPASTQAAASLVEQGERLGPEPVAVLDEVRGMAVLTQTCDIVRSCRDRPYLLVAPLVAAPPDVVDEVRRLKRPAYAHVPTAAALGLVVELDRAMTVEKAVVAGWVRTPGCATDEDMRAFGQAVARKAARFAFPDEFTAATQAFRARLIAKHGRASSEGQHIQALREIRVRASPAWDADEVAIELYFIKDNDPPDVPVNWDMHLEGWVGRIDWSRRYRKKAALCVWLQDITALEYVESDRLDLDNLSA